MNTVIISSFWIDSEKELHSNFYGKNASWAWENIKPYIEKAKIEHVFIDTSQMLLDKIVEDIVAKNPVNLVIFTHFTNQNSILKLIEKLREVNKTINIILIGEDAEISKKIYIDNGANFCLNYMVETGLTELLHNLNSPFNPFFDKISKLHFKNYLGNVTTNGVDETITIDQLDFPSLKNTEISTYRLYEYPQHINFLESSPISNYRHSPSYILNLIKKYNLKIVEFIDYNFANDSFWLEEFSRLKREEFLSFTYSCNIDEMSFQLDSIPNLVNSNCTHVNIVIKVYSSDNNEKKNKIKSIVDKFKSNKINTKIQIINLKNIVTADVLEYFSNYIDEVNADDFEVVVFKSDLFNTTLKEYILNKIELKKFEGKNKLLNPSSWKYWLKDASIQNKLMKIKL